MSDRVAVMNGGRIEMTGTPVEVYRRPRTEFVAQFLGHCNFITGTVRERTSPGEGVVQTVFGAVAIDMESVPAAGSAVRLMIRPEDLMPVSNVADTDALQIHAELSGTMYFGEHQEADACSQGQSLRIKVQGAALADGQRLALRLRQPRCWAFAAA